MSVNAMDFQFAPQSAPRVGRLPPLMLRRNLAYRQTGGAERRANL